ncbi:hypothetical protein K8I61_12990 [bacterium]|nr:hypothetical protein [bacterium]
MRNGRPILAALLIAALMLCVSCSCADSDDDDADGDDAAKDDADDDHSIDDDESDDDTAPDDDADDDDDDDDTGDDDTSDDDTGDDDDDACGAWHAQTAWPTEGYLLAFNAVGQFFYTWVTGAEGVAHIESWLASAPSADTLGIPGGPIELDATHNPGYAYRHDPDGVTFGDVWIELCDAAPCYVEQDAAGWLANPTTWCPWAARVKLVWDCTGGGPDCGAPVFVSIF